MPPDRARSAHNRPRPELGEGDDFAGVRAYEPGQSQRQIDWKAVARGHPLMTKQYTTEATGALYLDFAAVPGDDTEARLAQLAPTEQGVRLRTNRAVGIVIQEMRPQ